MRSMDYYKTLFGRVKTHSLEDLSIPKDVTLVSLQESKRIDGVDGYERHRLMFKTHTNPNFLAGGRAESWANTYLGAANLVHGENGLWHVEYTPRHALSDNNPEHTSGPEGDFVAGVNKVIDFWNELAPTKQSLSKLPLRTKLEVGFDPEMNWTIQLLQKENVKLHPITIPFGYAASH